MCDVSAASANPGAGRRVRADARFDRAIQVWTAIQLIRRVRWESIHDTHREAYESHSVALCTRPCAATRISCPCRVAFPCTVSDLLFLSYSHGRSGPVVLCEKFSLPLFVVNLAILLKRGTGGILAITPEAAARLGVRIRGGCEAWSVQWPFSGSWPG